MSRRITLHDLAADLGLSKTTVGDALAGSGRVSDETRDIVRQAATRLGYVSNRAARTLRKGSAGAIGLYFPAATRSLSFYMDFTFGAADAATGHDLDLTILTSSRPVTRDITADGVVLIDPLPNDPFVVRLINSGVPLVTAGRIPKRHRNRAAIIEIDHRRMARTMFDHLRSEGAERVAFICPDSDFNSSWSGDVRSAYRLWCRRQQLPEMLRPLSISPGDRELRGCITELMRPLRSDGTPTGLVCAAQSLAGRALTLLASMGLRVNEEVVLGSLVGDPSELSNPLISTIDLHARTFGAESVELLLRLVDGQAQPGSVTRHTAELLPAQPSPARLRLSSRAM